MQVNCDVLNSYNITKNYILYRPIHLKIEFLVQFHLMQLLYLVMDYHMVDNNLIDMMNLLVLNYQEFRSQYQRQSKSMEKQQKNIE